MAITEITTKSIKDGEVVNADVNASAAIAGSKISPNFGSQNITTTGNIDCASDANKLRLGASQDLQLFHDGSHSFIQHDGTGDLIIYGSGEDLAKFKDDGAVEVYYDNSLKLATSSAGVTVTGSVTDSKGDVRSIPANAQSGAYVAVAADAGKVIYISTGGVTVNTSVFSAGDAITIINNSGSNQTITQGTSMTIYNTSDGTSGNKTLGARGMATIWFAANDIGYISGGGLS